MKSEKFILYFSSILIVLFPFFLIKSAAADIACVVIGVLYLIFCTLQKDFSYFKNNYFKFFLIIFIYININSLFSFKPLVSLETSLPYFRVILFVIALSFFFKKITNLKLYFYYSFLICILILFLGSIFQIWSGHNPWGFVPSETTRISSFFGNKLVMGSYVARLLPLFLGIGILLNFKKLNFLILIISSILVILSAERLSFAYLLICVVFYFYLSFSFKQFFYSTIFFLIIFFSLFLIFPKNYERLFIHTYNQVKENKNILGLSYRHNLHYITAWNMFLDKKIIGQGLKSFRYLCDNPKFTVQKKIIDDHTITSPEKGYLTIKPFNNIDDGINYIEFLVLNNKNEVILKKNINITPGSLLKYFVDNKPQEVNKNQKIYSYYEHPTGCNTHPHNIYLQFLAELGIVGFIIFSIIFIYSLFCVIILSKKKLTKELTKIEQCSILTLLCVVISMFPFFPSGSYFNNWILIISYLPIGFYLYLTKEKNV
jgi:O-antigen ligase